ncbi:sulfur carrier protein ThiS adenylyltransferase [Desulfonatronum thiosulfatophilum]|uniref:Sulfur carrier protein ThiS adenylyltransferase n=1 Tax=Desulfonatronum thiosulfatophilum TaxID=617002 RepID=A0A1G6C6Z8_9BACT|nr:sulfur carrier protein ThiS adenylyltransferase ThiF [Desulfonatronum thiosulfatophilum]SDB28591.1 sulfur carrier protein ThiS adenylyltransferase [Desulfonatronum thiosulfatophilum]
MNFTEQGIAGHIGTQALERLQQARIGLAGAGGLGSNCAHFLVRAGFKRFVLVDFDRVEASNLNRQFFFPDQIGQPKVAALAANLLRINPNLELDLFETRITGRNVHELFARCTAVAECVDDPGAKKLLAESMVPVKELFVAASGVAGYGDPDRIRTRMVRPGFLLVGDETSTCCLTNLPQAPIVALAAARQADAILTWHLTPTPS